VLSTPETKQVAELMTRLDTVGPATTEQENEELVAEYAEALKTMAATLEGDALESWSSAAPINDLLQSLAYAQLNDQQLEIMTRATALLGVAPPD
jgi:hypothetical protein